MNNCCFLVLVFHCFFNVVRLLFFIAVCHYCVSMLFFIVVYHFRVSLVCFIRFSLLNDCCMVVFVFSFLCFIVVFIVVVRHLSLLCVIVCLKVIFHCRVSFGCLIGFSLLNNCCMVVERLLFFHSFDSLLFSLLYDYSFSLLCVITVFNSCFSLLCFIF